MALPLLPILGGLGAVGSFLGGRSAANSQKEMMRRQAQLGQAQTRLFNQTTPYYQAMLQQYARSMGIQVPTAPAGMAAPAAATQQGGGGLFGRVRQAGAPAPRPAPASIAAPSPAAQAPAATGLLGSNWGTPEDQLRFQAAEEDINRLAQNRANQLRFQLGGRGVADSTIAAALAQNEARAGDELARFRRGLAIAAPQEQAQRFAQFGNFLGPALGAGVTAANIYGQQGGVYGQQAGQAFGNIGNILQQQAYMDALRRRPPQPLPGDVEYDIWNYYG